MSLRSFRSFWLLIFILLPLASHASELDHVTSFLGPLLIIAAIVVIGLVVFGIYAESFILPKLYSLSGPPLLAVSFLGVLMVIAIYYLFSRYHITLH
jgi:Mg2+ and Co2+ transporter CorA